MSPPLHLPERGSKELNPASVSGSFSAGICASKRRSPCTTWHNQSSCVKTQQSGDTFTNDGIFGGIFEIKNNKT
jgi:hypothetical protein